MDRFRARMWWHAKELAIAWWLLGLLLFVLLFDALFR